MSVVGDVKMVFRSILILLLASLLFGSAWAQEQKAPAPVMALKSLEHDFGRVKEGTPLSYSFEFKNEGNADLVVESVAPE